MKYEENFYKISKKLEVNWENFNKVFTNFKKKLSKLGVQLQGN